MMLLSTKLFYTTVLDYYLWYTNGKTFISDRTDRIDDNFALSPFVTLTVSFLRKYK